MKAFCIALLLFSLAPVLPAQEAPVTPDPSGVTTPRYSREEIKQLVGPIALYPDPLIGLILPASTFPSDIVLAARFVETGDDLSLVDDKPWDVSVRALTRYPDVLKWMDENLEWTTQLGLAYLAQPNEVMEVIQELRAQAQQVGNLVDTPQQKIVREESYIRIVPADPEYIHVPYYDPWEVYYERPVAAPYLTFGPRWLTGWWLCFDFDWHHRRLYCGDWDGGWDYHHHRDRRDYHGDTVYINERLTNYEVWEGDRNRRRASARTFAELGGRQRTLAQPTRFRDRPELASKVERTLAKRDERWAKRAVSSGLAENSIASDFNRRGRGAKDRLETEPGATADRSRPRAEPKSRSDKVPKSGKDRLATPQSAAPSIGDVKPDRRGLADDKGGKSGRDRLETPQRDAPNAMRESKGKAPSRETQSDRPDLKNIVPRADSAPKAPGGGKSARERGTVKSPEKRSPATDEVKGPSTTMKPRTDAPRPPGVKGGGRDLKSSAAASVRKEVPKTSSGPSVQKSSPKPTPSASVRQGPSKSKSSGPPSIKKSSPKPKAIASAPRKSPPKSSVHKSPSRSRPVAKVQKSPPRTKSPAKQISSAPKPKVQPGKPSGGGKKPSASTSEKKKKK